MGLYFGDLWRGIKKALISNPGGDFNAIRDETARKRIQVPCHLPSAKISKKNFVYSFMSLSTHANCRLTFRRPFIRPPFIHNIQRFLISKHCFIQA